MIVYGVFAALFDRDAGPLRRRSGNFSALR
jgi:hypothetical protein